MADSSKNTVHDPNPSRQASARSTPPDPSSRFKLTPNKRELARVARGAVLHSSVAGSTASFAPHSRSPAKRPSPPKERVGPPRIGKPKQLRAGTLRGTAPGPGSPSERFRLSPNKFSQRSGTGPAVSREAEMAARTERTVKRKSADREGKKKRDTVNSDAKDENEHVIPEPAVKRKKPAIKRSSADREETEYESAVPAQSPVDPELTAEAAPMKEGESTETAIKAEPSITPEAAVKPEPTIKTEPVDDAFADAQPIAEVAPASEEESIEGEIKADPTAKGEPGVKDELDIKEEPFIKEDPVD